jgi:tetratricopeptide (TPR) repeat protein
VNVQQAPTISRSTFGRTLGVAGWVLAVTALAEIVGAGFALMDRARHVPPLTIQVPPVSLTAETTQPPLPAHSAASPSFGDPFASITSSTPAQKLAAPTPAPLAAATPPGKPATKSVASAATPAAATTPLAAATPLPSAAPMARATPLPPGANLPKPTPVEETQVVGPQSQVDGLLTEAIALRQKGDMSTAITRLREALAMSPKSPQLLTELAGTYEKMNLEDKASEVWRAIYDLGDSAGVYYQLADAKLKAAELSPGASGQAPGSDNTGTNPAEGGFQQGSVLALVNLSTDEKPETSEGYKRFTLKIPVKRREDAKIDVSGVVIQVFFYDQLGDDTVVRTNANVSSHWATLPADWVQDDIEILEVDYTQAPPEPGKIEEGRHYYGYVVCVYYNKELQDQVADPVSLIKTFPPPLTLPEK